MGTIQLPGGRWVIFKWVFSDYILLSEDIL